jgi:hypothetical protein
VGSKLVFLIVSRVMSVLGLSRRELWWKDAEILMLRHQLAVAQRQRPRVHSRLTWPDRAWLALLAGTLPMERLSGMGRQLHRRVRRRLPGRWRPGGPLSYPGAPNELGHGALDRQLPA